LEFGEFYGAEYRRIAKALFLLTGSGTDAEELAQEAMARTYERWARVRTMDNPVGYVYTVALNLHRRRHRRRPPKLGPPPAPQDPEAMVQERSEVAQALAMLTIEQRQAVVLVEWLGFDASQAGRLLGVDAASVRGRLHRARESLRERLGVRDG
jgi:RNA polymerase sigma factor (sigma-70 family)